MICSHLFWHKLREEGIWSTFEFRFNIQFICKLLHFRLEHKEQEKNQRTQTERGAVTAFSPPLAKSTTKNGKNTVSL